MNNPPTTDPAMIPTMAAPGHEPWAGSGRESDAPSSRLLTGTPLNGSTFLNALFLEMCGIAFEPGYLLAGRYEIVRRVSRGGMGEIYEALDREVSLPVAIKVLRPDLQLSGRLIEQLKGEVRVARLVDHPNVGRIFELAKETTSGGETAWFFAMPFFKGRNLAEHVQLLGTFSARKSKAVMEQISSGVAAIHGKDVVHGDLKPSNVMLVGDGENLNPLILDFGVATFLTADGGRPICGRTPQYSSPELIAYNRASKQSDVFALGRTWQFMWTGHAEGELPRWVKLKHPLCSRILARCIAADPSSRYASAVQVRRAIRAAKWTARAGTSLVFCVLVALFAMWWYAITQPVTHAGNAAFYYNYGLSKLRSGATFEAVRAFDRALTYEPTWALLVVRRAQGLYQLGDQKQALAEIGKLNSKRLKPKLQHPDREYVQYVQALLTRNYERSIQVLSAAIPHLPSSEVPGAYLDMGTAYELSGKPKEAIKCYEQIKSPLESSAVLLRLARIHADALQTALARQECREAVSRFRTLSDTEGLLEAMYSEGYIERRYGDGATARSLLQEVGESGNKSGHWYHAARAYIQLSALERQEGHLDLAGRHAETALKLIRDYDLYPLSADAHQVKADLLVLLNKVSAAEAEYRTALTFAKDTENQREIAFLLLCFADLEKSVGQLEQAGRNAEEASRIADQYLLQGTAEEAYFILGRIRRDQNQYQLAKEAFEKQLTLAKQGEFAIEVARAESGLASLYKHMGAYPEALVHLDRSLETAAAAKDSLQVAFNTLEKAYLLAYLGQISSAEEALVDVSNLARQIPLLSVDVEIGKAQISILSGRPARAISRLGAIASQPGNIDSATRPQVITTSCQAYVMSHSKRGAAECLAIEQLLNETTDAQLRSEELFVLIAYYIDRKEFAQALGQLDANGKAVQMRPESIWRLSALRAIIEDRLGQTAEAEQFRLRSLEELGVYTRDWSPDLAASYRVRPDLAGLVRYISSPGAVIH